MSALSATFSAKSSDFSVSLREGRQKMVYQSAPCSIELSSTLSAFIKAFAFMMALVMLEEFMKGDEGTHD